MLDAAKIRVCSVVYTDVEVCLSLAHWVVENPALLTRPRDTHGSGVDLGRCNRSLALCYCGIR
jgi:hypothetical protein